MPLHAASSLLDALRTVPILRPAQLDELEREGPDHFGEARTLAQHLLERGWLTPYQVNQLLLERGPDLVLGPYVLIERLGEGFGGQLFKARHHLMDRIVALRVIRQELIADAQALEQFYQQVEAASQLAHDNVVHAYDAGPIGQTHFLATEYVAGIDLAQLVRQHGPLSVAHACSYIYQAALGLQHGWEHQLAHRGLKPSKLMVARKSAGEARKVNGRSATETRHVGSAMVKVLDLGLSRLLRAPTAVRRRTPGSDEAEAAYYLAPEQRVAGKAADIRADIYSLGCIFHFLLTGQPLPACPVARVPVGPGTDSEAAVGPDMRVLEQLRPEVPVAVTSVLVRMAAHAPEDRYSVPAEVAQALQEFVGFGEEADDLDFSQPAAVDPLNSDTDVVPIPARGRRRLLDAWRWLLYVGLSAALLLTGLFLVYSFLTATPTTRPTDPSLQPDSPVRTAWKELLARTGDAKTDRAALWHDIARWRSQNPGTPEALEAAQWLVRLPSPLDRLDDKKVSAEDRACAGSLKDLVAVLGEQRLRTWHVIRGMALRPDGKVAAAAVEGQVVLWDTATGVPFGVLKGPARINSLAYSADGLRLATSASDKHIRVWDVAAAKEQVVLPHLSDLTIMALAPDKVHVASGTKGGGIHIWNIAQKKKLFDLTGHKSAVQCLAYSPDGTLLASGGQDGTVRLWSIQEKKEVAKLGGHEGGVNSVAFSPDGTLFASGGADRHLRLTNVETRKEHKRLKHSEYAVLTVAFAPNGQLVASGSHDNSLKVWDTASGQEKAKFTVLDYAPISGIAFTLDSQKVWTADHSHALRLWNLADPKATAPVVGHTRVVTAVTFAPDGLSLASTGLDRNVCFWDTGSGKERLALRHRHTGRQHALAFSPDSKTLAVGGDDKLVRLWDAQAGNELATFGTFKQSVRGIEFAPDGQTLAAVSIEPTIKLWDVATRKEKDPFKGELHSKPCIGVAFTPDGQSLITAGQDQTVRMWDVAEGSEKLKLGGQTGDFNCVACSPDGHLLAAAGNNSIRLWDERGQALPKPPVVHRGTISGLAFSPDGQTLASVGGEGMVVLWKVPGGVRLREWQLPGPIQGVAFAPDGRHLATANANCSIYIIRLARAGSPVN